MGSPNSLKICSLCKEEKSELEFHKNKRTTDGLNFHCKQCRKDYVAKDPGRVAKSYRHWRLKKKFGISEEIYEQLFKIQKGCCAICGKDQILLSRKMAVDHCHITNKVRGLLCSNCNTGIGNLRDDISLLQKAIKYLEQ